MIETTKKLDELTGGKVDELQMRSEDSIDFEMNRGLDGQTIPAKVTLEVNELVSDNLTANDLKKSIESADLRHSLTQPLQTERDHE